MKPRTRWAVALLVLVGAAGMASANNVPLAEVTTPWLRQLRSGDQAVRNVAAATLVDIVRKYPAAAYDTVLWMAVEQNGSVAGDYERCLVPLAKESPATVSALIRLLRSKDTNYQARSFGVKVLSQVGPAAATPEFVDAMAETYCPVPGSFLRVLRAMGKDSAPILRAAYHHPDANVRKWAGIGLRVIGSKEPSIQKLSAALPAEPPLLQKLREGAPADRVAAIAALADLARTSPGTATVLVKALDNVTDKEVLIEAEARLIALGRESPELVAVLVAGVRSDDDYRLRTLALKVLPKVGPTLTCKEIVDALGDGSCPVPGSMQKILLAAGADALPVLDVARKHANPHIRQAAESILQRIPRPAAASQIE